MSDLIERLEQLCKAYPEDIFTPLQDTDEDTEEKQRIITRAGAAMGRHIGVVFIRPAIAELREQQQRIEELEASHDDEEASHQETFRMLKLAQQRIAELETLTESQVKRTGQLTGQVDLLMRQRDEALAALDTCVELLSGGVGLHHTAERSIKKQMQQEAQRIRGMK